MAIKARVSLPTFDALTETDINNYSLYADSDNVLLKERASGAGDLNNGETDTITHSSGYIPFYIVMGETSTANRFEVTSGHDLVGANPGWRLTVTNTTLAIEQVTGTTRDYKYFIFYDNMT